MAMHAEAEPVIEMLGLRAVDRPPWASHVPMRLYEGKTRTNTIDLVVNGLDPDTGIDCIGTQAATASTMLGCEAFAPDLVVSAGTCGGFACRGGEIGTVYLAHDRVWYHDRRVPLPGFDRFSRGGYPCLPLDSIADDLGFSSGVISTGDSLDLSPADARRIDEVGAHVKDMEAAAVAWIAGLFGAKFTAVKVVTDLVDGPHPTEQEFLENLSMATDRLAEALTRFLREISDADLQSSTPA